MSTPEPQDLRTGDPHLRLEGEGIASIVFAHADGGPNLLGTGQVERLDAVLEEVERGIALGAVSAVVVRSARRGSWLSGADLREVAALGGAAQAAATARRGQAVLRRLERLEAPTLAAIEGACLGAGAELALACSYRLAADTEETALGFPEVRYGLLPALGGTVRLPRLVGARAALELVLTGRTVPPGEARALGLVDGVLGAAGFDAAVLAFARERVARGRLRTGARRGVGRRLVEDTAPGRRALFARARRGLLRDGAPPNPAGLRALEVIAGGIGAPLDHAFELEALAFGELAAAPESRALMHAFSLRRIARHPRGTGAAKPAAVETVALLGGGLFAGSLAHLLSSHGVQVRVRDADRAAVAEAVEWAREAVRWDERRGTVPAGEAAARVERISGGQGFGGFGTVDLAMELALGDEHRKRALLAEAESHLRHGAQLATTALTLTVEAVAAGLARPGRLAGIRFFPSPADPRIAEVVSPLGGHRPAASEASDMRSGPPRDGSPESAADAAAADLVVATLHGLARRIGVPALGVSDAPGGLLHRLALAYVREGIALLAGGASVEAVDGAAREMGLRDGPLAMADAVGLPTLARLAGVLAGEGADDGDAVRSAEALRTLVRREVVGVQAGRGFYTYRAGRPPRPSAEAAALVRRPRAGGTPPAGADEVRERLRMALVNESARALEAGIVRGAGEVDLAVMVGFGFPAYRGGLLYEADRDGLAQAVVALDRLAAAAGPRFAAAPLLRHLARSGGTFHAP